MLYFCSDRKLKTACVREYVTVCQCVEHTAALIRVYCQITFCQTKYPSGLPNRRHIQFRGQCRRGRPVPNYIVCMKCNYPKIPKRKWAWDLWSKCLVPCRTGRDTEICTQLWGLDNCKYLKRHKHHWLLWWDSVWSPSVQLGRASLVPRPTTGGVGDQNG